MLWKLLGSGKPHQDRKQPRNAQRSVNFHVHEEYHETLRTKSYVDFFNKVQSLANEPSIYSDHNKVSEILLEPCQNSIPSIIDTSFPSKTPELKNLMLNYFDNNAEAALICCYLLKIINQVECTYQFIERAFSIMDDHGDYSPKKFKEIIVDVNSFILSKNPFPSNLDKDDFKLINNKNSSMLHHLKSMREKVGREVKPMTSLKKTSILNFAIKNLKRKVPNSRFSRRKSLGKVCDQLDIAAKGTYILTKDFDTMSRLVARLCYEIEHTMFMVQFCLDKDGKIPLQIVKELKKSGVVFEKLVEELKEHVYLCLVTINRARCLVIKEVTEMCA